METKMSANGSFILELDPTNVPDNAGMIEAFAEAGISPDLEQVGYSRLIGLKGYDLVGMQLYLESGGADYGTSQADTRLQDNRHAVADIFHAFSGVAVEPVEALDVVEDNDEGLKGIALHGHRDYIDSGGAEAVEVAA